MGKSPGKWIKTKIFGKKSSKSGFAKDVATGKSTSIISKAQFEELALNPSVSTNTASQIPDRGGQNTEFEMDTTEDLPCDEVALLHRKKDADTIRTIGSKLPNDEIAREKEAATKTQAAFRGYLARRAFRALKGIMRLQALVRGHLVRRQAAATLGCMHAIVKFQALVRGRRIRLLDIEHEVVAKDNVGEPKLIQDAEGVNYPRIDTKLSTNAFIRKLIASLPNAMPLSLQYDQAEPNSSWNWLERWSYARVWEPLARSRKIVGAKPQKIQSITQIFDSEAAKPKRSSRKAPGLNGDNKSLHSSELERSKRNLRKLLSHQAESVQEQPQNELERVKRNLRKISASAATASEKSEVTIEKPEQSLRQVSNFPNPDIPEHKMDNTSKKISEVMVELFNPVDTEAPVKPLNEPVDMLPNDHSVAESRLKNSEKVENSLLLNEESSLKEDQNRKENQRTRRRRSFPSKQEHSENVSQNSPKLPSYMAATESAKAKLRADGNSMVGDNGAENDLLRRHSLPSLNSSSPRMQRQLQANRKGGGKSNGLLSLSRDEKPTQPGWRR